MDNHPLQYGGHMNFFLKHYKKYDKIVFTYSHYSRWSYLPEHLIGLSLIRPEGTINSPGFESHQDESMKKYVDILLKAHPIVYSEELQIFTYQNIFNSVNNLCKENNIKLINLMPFEQNYVNLELRKKLINFYIDISNATGSCLTGLADVSFGEALDKNGILQSDIIFKMGIDYRASHLSLENNKVLASIIADTFNSDQIVHTRLQQDARFLKGTLCNEN